MVERNSDVIIVTHTVHADIPEDDARDAIPTGSTVRAFVEIRPARIALSDTRGADWYALARAQRAEWMTKVVPLLSQYPKARIAYFGLSPIPLAIHLGSLTESWSGVDVYLRRHDDTRSWIYLGGDEPEVRGPVGPQESTRSVDPALIAVSTTTLVDVEAARQMVGATSAEVEIRTDPLGEDVLTSQHSVHAVAEAFRKSLGLLESHRPRIADIHVFAAVPCGLAFLIGTHITPTRHARVVTYQYHRSHEPRLCEALRVPERRSSPSTLDDAQRASAAALRSDWEREREALVDFARGAGKPWWSMLGEAGAVFGTGSFAKLQSVEETPITSAISLVDTAAAGEFRLEPTRKVWIFSDELLNAIRTRVDAARLGRAGRMLLLHESLHHGAQGLTLSTAGQIRLAPKVLEELDYLADAWTMLHEFAFEGATAKPWDHQRSVLIDILEDAVSTMWAFDSDREKGSLEVRRINRYLIWYVTLARIERSVSLRDAFAVLADKPVIELIGPLVHERDERLVARLDGQAARTYELCMLDRQGRLRRLGSNNAASVEQLALALGAHNGESVRAIVRSSIEQGDA